MAVRQPAFELLLVEEISRAFLVAEEEPVAALRAERETLLEECAERRDAGAGTDHDHRCVAIHRRLEAMGRLHKNGNCGCFVHAIREERGSDAVATATVRLVAHCGDGEMHFIRVRLEARRDRVKSRREFLQQRNEFRRREWRCEASEHINDLTAVEPFS